MNNLNYILKAANGAGTKGLLRGLKKAVKSFFSEGAELNALRILRQPTAPAAQRAVATADLAHLVIPGHVLYNYEHVITPGATATYTPSVIPEALSQTQLTTLELQAAQIEALKQQIAALQNPSLLRTAWKSLGNNWKGMAVGGAGVLGYLRWFGDKQPVVEPTVEAPIIAISPVTYQ